MYNPNVSIQLPSPANSTLDFNILKKPNKNEEWGLWESLQLCVFFFLLSFFPVRVSGVVTTSRKNKNPTLHSVPSGFIKRCNVGKILYLVNFKACQDYEPHRHYTIILGHKGLLHSLARGWNHSVTSCKQKMKKEKKKNTFWLIYWLGFFVTEVWSRSTKRGTKVWTVYDKPLFIHSTDTSK